MHESEKWKWVIQLCPTLSDPMDCSPPGSSVHGIFQARVLESVAIAVSTVLYSRSLLCAQSVSHVQLFATPWSGAPASSVHGIFQARILEWVASFYSGDLLNPGIKPASLASPALEGRFFTTVPPGKPRSLIVIYFIYSSVYMSIPTSQVIPPCLFPPW